MPYRVTNSASSCSGWAVVTDTGAVKGCHDTKREALSQLAALNINDPHAKRKLFSFRRKDQYDVFERMLLDEDYWQEYQAMLIAEAQPLLEAVYWAGVRAALTLSPVKAAVEDAPIPGLEEKVVEEATATALEQLVAVGTEEVVEFMAQWAWDLTNTTKRNMLDALTHARVNDLGSEYVLGRIKQDFSPVRAHRIAVTETTRFFGAGAQHVYKAAQLPGWEWQTVMDSWVCDICLANNNEQHRQSETFSPAHVNCRCFPRPVTHLSSRLDPASPEPPPIDLDEAFDINGIRVKGLNRLDPSVRADFEDALRMNVDRYPVLRQALPDGIEIGDFSALDIQMAEFKWIGQYGENSKILFNETALTRESLERFSLRAERRYSAHYDEWIEPHFGPGWKTNPLDSLVSHELGHAVQEYAVKSPGMRLNRIDVSDISKGKYAKTNAEEAFGEAFAELNVVHPDDWSDAAKQVGRWLNDNGLAVFDDNLLRALDEVPLTAHVPYPKDGFRTAGQVQIWAEENYPHIRWTIDTFDVGVLNNAMPVLDDLLQQYPHVAARFEGIGLDPWLSNNKGPNTLAWQRYDGTLQAWNPKYFGDPNWIKNSSTYDAVKRYETYDFKKNEYVIKETVPFHPIGTGSPAGTVAHEFGHAVDGYNFGAGKNAVPSNVAWSPAVGHDGEGLVYNFWSEFKEVRAVKLSGYAKESAEEKFAEGFSQMVVTPREQWNAYTFKVEAALKTVDPANHIKSDSWKFIGDLDTTEDRVAAREFINRHRKAAGLSERK